MTHRRITKRDNFFQRAEVIKRNREKRTRCGQFLVEGVGQIKLAIQFGWEISALLVTRELRSNWARDLVVSKVAQEVWELAPELMEDLSDKDETSEVLAIVKCRNISPKDLSPTLPNGLIVVFDRPTSPGNLGSSIRSADAFGADAVIVTGHAVDIYDPFVVRGSMGAIFSIPVATAPSHSDILEWVTQAREAGQNFQIIGSSGKTERLITQQTFIRPTILVMGNETVGMSRGYWEIADSVVKIPIGGAISSLNVSCATSILLYEVIRQRTS
jgi:TrmH family RNA methyltransferase